MKDFDKSFIYKLRLLLSYKDFFRNHFKPYSQHYFKHFHSSQIKAAHRLKGKGIIDVAFFLTIPGMWKSDEVYRAMLKNPHFHPYIVIYPYSVYKEFNSEEINQSLERTKRFIENKGYEYIIPFDEKKKKWVPINHIHKPDIVFFSSPYKDSYPKYFLYSFQDTLTCYIPYGFCSLRMDKTNYDMVFHNLVGLFFLETEVHQQLAKKNARNKGFNTIVSGYPATEIFLDKDFKPKDLWKPQSKGKKRIIYAPHHSIDKASYPSVFLETCEDMLKIAEKYADSVQFVFKPHQLLKFKLQQIWGIDKTEEYYRRWDSMENTQLVADGYEDLFLTSDALIHDCGSFTTEYLFTKKPVMYLCRNTDMTDKFNEFGIKSFEQHYHGHAVSEVEEFIEEVVINGKDPLENQRELFFNEYLMPKDGILPSQRILQTIENVINGDTSVFDD